MQKAQQFWRWISSSTAQIQYALLLAMAVAFPIIVLPLSDNFLMGGKVTLLFLFGLITMVLWTISVFVKKSVQLTLSPFLFPLLGFGVITIASLLVNGQPLLPQLLGVAGMYVIIAILGTLGSSLLPVQKSQRFAVALAIPAVILTLSSVAEVLQFGPSTIVNLILKTNYPHSPIFSLAGSPLIALQVLFAAASGVLGAFLATRNKEKTMSPAWVVTFFALLAGLGINLYTLYTVRESAQVFLPYNAGWSVVMEALKSVRTTAIGVGPDNYLAVYLQYKPAWVNLTNYWNLQFSQGSNLPLTLLPTLGVVGLAVWVWLAVQAVRHFLKASNDAKPAAAVVMGTLILQLLLPPNVVILGIQILAIMAWIAAEKEHLQDVQLHAFTVRVIKSDTEVRREPKHSNVMAYVITLFASVITLFAGYWFVRFTVGQWYEFLATQAIVENNAVKVYQLQQKMIIWNPLFASYRRAYSTTNMAIAIALSNSKDSTAEEKQQVVPLVQQSIREAKAAVTIEPVNSLNWVNLGRVYSNLIGVAQGAPEWSVNVYSTAQTMAPTDPILMMEYGNVLFQSGAYAPAEEAFAKAVSLKPDWASAHYNLANAARQNRDFERSLSEYQQTLSLLQGNSELYSRVKGEFEETQREAARAQGSRQVAPAPVTPAKTESKPATGSAKIRSLTEPTSTSSSQLSPSVKSDLQNAVEGP